MKRMLAVLLIAVLLMQALPVFAASTVKKGQYVTFGNYDQDNNAANGQEPIQWQVLDVQGSKALLLSVYVLDAYQYHNNSNGVVWNNSSLRAWLNGRFYDKALSFAEKSAIVPFVQNAQGTTYTAKVEIDDRNGASIWKDVKRSDRLIKLVTGKVVTVTGAEVKNDNYKYVPVTYKENGKTYTGYMESRFLKLIAYETVEVNDKVTILSKNEIKKYLGNNTIASPTGSAYAAGTKGYSNRCWWWTRDEVKTTTSAPAFNDVGTATTLTATTATGGVRPALWVDTSKIDLKPSTELKTTNKPKPTATPKPTSAPSTTVTRLKKNSPVVLKNNQRFCITKVEIGDNLKIKTDDGKELTLSLSNSNYKFFGLYADWKNVDIRGTSSWYLPLATLHYGGKEYTGYPAPVPYPGQLLPPGNKINDFGTFGMMWWVVNSGIGVSQELELLYFFVVPKEAASKGSLTISFRYFVDDQPYSCEYVYR